MSWHGPRAGRIRRSLRRLGLDRNQMRRGTDRVQAILRAGLLAAFLIGGPAIACSASHGVYVSGLRTARAQAADWHRVAAVVLRVTDTVTGWQRSRALIATLSVRWTMPDGSSRTAEITGAGHAAGSTVMVWIDNRGRLTRPPLSHADVVEHMVDAAVAAPAALALLLGTAGWAASRALDRRRLAGWEADWSVVEPQWTGRR